MRRTEVRIPRRSPSSQAPHRYCDRDRRTKGSKAFVTTLTDIRMVQAGAALFGKVRAVRASSRERQHGGFACPGQDVVELKAIGQKGARKCEQLQDYPRLREINTCPNSCHEFSKRIPLLETDASWEPIKAAITRTHLISQTDLKSFWSARIEIERLSAILSPPDQMLDTGGLTRYSAERNTRRGRGREQGRNVRISDGTAFCRGDSRPGGAFPAIDVNNATIVHDKYASKQRDFISPFVLKLGSRNTRKSGIEEVHGLHQARSGRRIFAV